MHGFNFWGLRLNLEEVFHLSLCFLYHPDRYVARRIFAATIAALEVLAFHQGLEDHEVPQLRNDVGFGGALKERQRKDAEVLADGRVGFPPSQ